MTVDELIRHLENLSVTCGGDAKVKFENQDGDWSEEFDEDQVLDNSITYDDHRQSYVRFIF